MTYVLYTTWSINVFSFVFRFRIKLRTKGVLSSWYQFTGRKTLVFVTIRGFCFFAGIYQPNLLLCGRNFKLLVETRSIS